LLAAGFALIAAFALVAAVALEAAGDLVAVFALGAAVPLEAAGAFAAAGDLEAAGALAAAFAFGAAFDLGAAFLGVTCTSSPAAVATIKISGDAFGWAAAAGLIGNENKTTKQLDGNASPEIGSRDFLPAIGRKLFQLRRD
jgi:hypothetical protein